MNKIEKAIETCENVLDGMETETISVASALLQCFRIARLTNDVYAVKWLQYELGGYPGNSDGYIEHNAWQIAWDNGRGYISDGKNKAIFNELASELEEKVSAQKKAVNNFTTQGASVSGDHAFLAMRNLTDAVSSATKTQYQM